MCVIKAMMTWHGEKTFRICRERCGGGSYLQNTIVGDSIYNAHSGMTAEGDNSVLMQKVVKDLLEHSSKGLHTFPKVKPATIKQMAKMESVSNFVCMKNLIFLKEQLELKAMGKRL